MAFQYISHEVLGRLIRDGEFRNGLLAIEAEGLIPLQQQVDAYLTESGMSYSAEETLEIAEFLIDGSGEQAAARLELGIGEETAM